MTWTSWTWPEELAAGTWALIAAFFAATLFLAHMLGFHGFAGHSLKLLFWTAVMLGLAGSTYIRRLPMAATICAVFAWNLVLLATMPVGNYVFAGLNLPLMDSGLQRIDHNFGLDTVRTTAWLGQFDLLSQGAAFVYHKVVIVMYLAVAVLILRGEAVRLRDLMTLTTVTLVITSVLAGFMPAIGPFPLQGSIDAVAGHLKGQLPTSYIPHFTGVRDGSLRFLGEGHKWDGLTTFPSYHTAFALCAAYGLASTRYLAWPAAGFCGAVVLATFPVGGHYAVDIVVGIVIFMAVLAVIKRQSKSRDQLVITAAPRTDGVAGIVAAAR